MVKSCPVISVSIKTGSGNFTSSAMYRNYSSKTPPCFFICCTKSFQYNKARFITVRFTNQLNRFKNGLEEKN